MPRLSRIFAFSYDDRPCHGARGLPLHQPGILTASASRLHTGRGRPAISLRGYSATQYWSLWPTRLDLPPLIVSPVRLYSISNVEICNNMVGAKGGQREKRVAETVPLKVMGLADLPILLAATSCRLAGTRDHDPARL